MDLKNLLLEIEKHTDHVYIEVAEGVAEKIGTGEKIPAELFLYYTVPENGFYKLMEYTCSGNGGCKIGEPAMNCVEWGITDPRKCAVYGTTAAKGISIRIPVIGKIITDLHSN